MFQRAILMAGVAMLCASAAHAGIVVTLNGDGVDTNRLRPGQNFDVLVSLSADPGESIDNVRLMQLDHELSSGSSIDAFAWEIAGINDSLYFKEVFPDGFPTVVRANYVDVQPEPGFILNLTDAPSKIGRYNLTYGEPGFLNLLGNADPPNGDSSIRFQSGFEENVRTYSQREGNVSGGILALTPEPGTLSLLVLGGLAMIARRRRRA